MSTIRKFFLRDVRCFDGEHAFTLRPLTFLIGENSTGKSTVLGCLQALGTFCNFRFMIPFDPYEIDFNSEPYQMGSFADLVRRSRPKKEKFQLGFEYNNGGKKIKNFLTLTESRRGSEPSVFSIKWVFEEGEILFLINESNQDQKNGPFNVTYVKDQSKFRVLTNIDRYHWPWLNLMGVYNYLSESRKELDDASRNLLEFISRQFPQPEGGKNSGSDRWLSLEDYRFGMTEFHSIAPIRSKPKRTYNPLKETKTPEGSEIPMVLMNLSTSSKRKWQTLRKRLVNFGKASGLFSDITMRKMGSSKSDPFQLQIKVRGPKTNLIDVGYGVSQVLPILVRVLTEQNAKFLLQQPEVHLHPKGQAELASLLVEINKRNKNSFVIETHSDYMIDRVRIEIIKGNLNPEDVSLIYLKPVGNKVRTFNISFDAQANMIGRPPGFREFFLKESRELLFFGK